MKYKNGIRTALISAIVALTCGAAQAADWSDTSISYATGNKFAEPYGSNDISKSIINLTHASGYKYGSNFFSTDMLLSDSKDPAYEGATTGAQEFYLVYRHTLDLGAVTGTSFKAGPVRGLGVTAGFDLNTKTDAGYNSKKRMVVAGPTLMMDVPGFLNVSLLALWESNAPYSTYTDSGVSRYNYDVHPMLNLAWGIPFSVGPVPLSFEGFANFIASKGKNEYGGDTAAETLIDLQLMYDVGAAVGGKAKTFRVGLEYQWWRNKFGNSYKDRTPTTGAGDGAFAKTPMIRAQYHF